MWSKNFCLTLFLNLYNKLFWAENHHIYEENKVLESKVNTKSSAKSSEISTVLNNILTENLQEENILTDFEEMDIKNQVDAWQEKSSEITQILSKIMTDWNKTLITTKALLICAYLEINFLSQQNPDFLSEFVASDSQNLESLDQLTKNKKTNMALLVTKYLKIGQDYLDNKNVSLIHAVLTKIFEETKKPQVSD